MPAPLRSLLFAPANRPERFDKALAAGASAVIIDLEDAVPGAQKAAARQAVAAWLSSGHAIILRINGTSTPWHGDDLTLARHAGVLGVMLPKAESGHQVQATADACGKAVLPLIESAKGLVNINEIAAAPGVWQLVFGSIDFQLDLGLSCDESDLLPYRAQIVLASRLAGLDKPIDGVTTQLDNPSALTLACAHSYKLGFGGKLCIHPRQIETVNAQYRPSEQEIAWARRIIDTAEKSAGAAIAVDGHMVDQPVILKAQHILRAAR